MVDYIGIILAAAGAAFGILGTLLGAILKYTVDKRDREIDRRFEELVKKHETAVTDARKTDDETTKKLAEEVKVLTQRQNDEAKALLTKTHEAEVARIKLESEVALIRKGNETIDRDLVEIRNEMVPRKEWQERMDRLEEKLDNFARFSRWSPPAGIPRVQTIPREEDIDEYKQHPRKR